MHRSSQSGFTLIELLVVVAILAILSAIAIPQLNRHRLAAIRSEAITQLSYFDKMQTSYYADRGQYAAVGVTLMAVYNPNIIYMELGLLPPGTLIGSSITTRFGWTVGGIFVFGNGGTPSQGYRALVYRNIVEHDPLTRDIFAIQRNSTDMGSDCPMGEIFMAQNGATGFIEPCTL